MDSRKKIPPYISRRPSMPQRLAGTSFNDLNSSTLSIKDNSRFQEAYSAVSELKSRLNKVESDTKIQNRTISILTKILKNKTQLFLDKVLLIPSLKLLFQI